MKNYIGLGQFVSETSLESLNDLVLTITCFLYPQTTAWVMIDMTCQTRYVFIQKTVRLIAVIVESRTCVVGQTVLFTGTDRYSCYPFVCNLRHMIALEYVKTII